jgi:hypothetical protein
MKKYLILFVFILTLCAGPTNTKALTVPNALGMFSYGGIVLAAWPCLHSIVILVGPPSPAIINYQPPITFPRPGYLPFIPLQRDLGNAWLGGFCLTDPFTGFWVPTGVLLGSTVLF